MSSISSARKPGTLWIAACIAAAAMSSGRVADRAPLGALPTAVRTADTITAAILFKPEFSDYLSISVPQHISFFQQILHSREGLLFTTQRLKRLPLEIQKILFRRSRLARYVSAAEYMREFAGDVRFIIGNMTGLPHQVHTQI